MNNMILAQTHGCIPADSLMKEKMLCQPTTIQILLIYRKHFAMMSSFFVVIIVPAELHMWVPGQDLAMWFDAESVFCHYIEHYTYVCARTCCMLVTMFLRVLSS